MADDVATARSEVRDAAAANGHGGSTSASTESSASQPLPPPGRNTSLRPVMVVVGIAVGLVTVFLVFSALAGGGGSNNSGTTNSSAASKVPGTSLEAVPSLPGLSPIEQGGEPPSNILNAVTLPKGSTRVSHVNNAGDAGQYDQQVSFTVPASESAVFDFYRTEMHHAGWNVSNAGLASDHTDLEVLGKLAGDDGFYWEMGATVSPTTFASGASGPGTGAETTHFTIRLFQVPDES